MSRWRTIGSDLIAARATMGVVFVLVVVQAVIEGMGGFSGVPRCFEILGLSRKGLVEGRYWQLATYAMIHGNWVHLMINAAALLAFGSRVERIGGSSQVLRILLIGWLAGGLFHLGIGGAGGGAPVLVGISGGVMALLLWLTGVSPGSRMWPLAVSGKNLGLGIMLSSGLLALINPELSIPYLSGIGFAIAGAVGIDIFNVAHACHFGGALAGWGMARWTLRPRVSLAKLQADRARREAASEPRH